MEREPGTLISIERRSISQWAYMAYNNTSNVEDDDLRGC